MWITVKCLLCSWRSKGTRQKCENTSSKIQCKVSNAVCSGYIVGGGLRLSESWTTLQSVSWETASAWQSSSKGPKTSLTKWMSSVMKTEDTVRGYSGLSGFDMQLQLFLMILGQRYLILRSHSQYLDECFVTLYIYSAIQWLLRKLSEAAVCISVEAGDQSSHKILCVLVVSFW